MTMRELTFHSAFAELPLVSILRGISPPEVEGVGSALIEAGFRLIEVPLTSPEPFKSIEILVRRFGEMAIIGAGTVRSEPQLDTLIQTGGQLMVTPHGDTTLIAAAKRRGLAALPGVATPTEAFAAIDAGADALKVFPADAVPPAILRSWRTVLPANVPLCPTGGVTPEGLAAYVDAGAGGFGIGTQLYKPGWTRAAVGARAQAYVAAWRQLSDPAANA